MSLPHSQKNFVLGFTGLEDFRIKGGRRNEFNYEYSKRYGMESGEIIILKRGHLRCPPFFLFPKKKEEIRKINRQTERKPTTDSPQFTSY